MPIDYHHSAMLPSEVNELHHLAEATLLYQFCMESTHHFTTQPHAKENLFKSTCSHGSISSPSDVNELLHLAEAATQSNSQEAATQSKTQEADIQTCPACHHNDT